MKPNLSIVIPVYNSQESLQQLIDRLAKTLPHISHQFEVIFINDGSRDQSWERIQQASEEYAWVRGIDLMRNYGQHHALLCGIRAAQYEVAITMDDDLQHPPEEIHKLLDELDKGYDVVYGIPIKQQHGFWRNLASYITRLALQSTMGIDIARNVSAFRAIKTEVREAFSNYHSPFVILDVLLTWGTNRFSAVTVQHDSRKLGTSNYTFSKLISHAINMVTGFTTLPLRLASLMGFGFAFFGLAVLMYVIGRYIIQGGSVPGFPFLASIIAIFSGAQLFALGIIGEYLSRMHFRIMDRPSYVVRKSTGFHEVDYDASE